MEKIQGSAAQKSSSQRHYFFQRFKIIFWTSKAEAGSLDVGPIGVYFITNLYNILYSFAWVKYLKKTT